MALSPCWLPELLFTRTVSVPVAPALGLVEVSVVAPALGALVLVESYPPALGGVVVLVES
jgi:hypothetical protein